LTNAKKHIENTRTVFRVAESLHNYKEALASPGREFLEESDSFDIETEGKPVPARLILFNDLILVTKAHRSLTLTGPKTSTRKFVVVGSFATTGSSYMKLDSSKIYLTSAELKKPVVLIPKNTGELNEWIDKIRRIAKVEEGHRKSSIAPDIVTTTT